MSAITAIFDVFGAVGDWIVDSLTTLTGLFYAPESGLTLFGVLTVVGLGFSVVFLLINKIRDFLKFR